MARLDRMNEIGGRAGGGECRGDLAGDMAGLADAHANDPPLGGEYHADRAAKFLAQRIGHVCERRRLRAQNFARNRQIVDVFSDLSDAHIVSGCSCRGRKLGRSARGINTRRP